MNNARPRPAANRILGICAFAALAFGPATGLATAQNTWVVDAASGPGSDYANLSSAFAAVPAGDTIRVRPGFYDPAQLTRAIRLVFEPGAYINQTGALLEVRNTPAGSICSIHGLTLSTSAIFLGGGGIEVANCQGAVLIDGVTFTSGTSVPSLRVQNSASVSISNSTIRPAVRIHGSDVTASDCNFFGQALASSAHTIDVSDSRLELSHCSSTGGGAHGFAFDALFARDSNVIVRGDSDDRFTHASYFGFVSEAMRAAGTTTLTLDPAVRVSKPPVGFTTIDRRPMPVLSAIGDSQSLDVKLEGPQGEAFGILVGLPGTPLDTLFFGTLWIDGLTMTALVAGVFDATEQFEVQIPRSTSPSAVGLPLTFQAVTAGSAIELSNAATVVVDSGI